MKVLWISARIFDDTNESKSGVWQKAMALKLAKQKEIIIGNITSQNNIKDVQEYRYRNIVQWNIPKTGSIKKGYPPKETILLFEKIAKIFKPDIIHIWGSENPFKLLPFDSKIPGIKVLVMQGVLSSMGRNNLRGMSIYDLFSSFGIQELIYRNSIFSTTLSFFKEGKIENKMIKKSEFIINQSDWTDSQIKPVNPNAVIYRTHRVLRDEFYTCNKWNEYEHKTPLIFTSALGYSWKGLHLFLKALPIVKYYFQNLHVNIAGKIGRTDMFAHGYLRMMLKIIKRNNLENNISWVNDLTVNEIIDNLQKASVYVNPSFVESYSNAFAEAMYVGTPSVISFAGAMPELAQHNKEALFFTPGDYRQCAYQIIKLLSNDELSLKISENAIKRAEKRSIEKDIINEQIRIYKDILTKKQNQIMS